MVVHSGQRPPLHLSQTVCFLSPDIVNISESFLSPLINVVESCVDGQLLLMQCLTNLSDQLLV